MKMRINESIERMCREYAIQQRERETRRTHRRSENAILDEQNIAEFIRILREVVNTSERSENNPLGISYLTFHNQGPNFEGYSYIAGRIGNLPSLRQIAALWTEWPAINNNSELISRYRTNERGISIPTYDTLIAYVDFPYPEINNNAEDNLVDEITNYSSIRNNIFIRTASVNGERILSFYELERSHFRQ